MRHIIYAFLGFWGQGTHFWYVEFTNTTRIIHSDTSTEHEIHTKIYKIRT